MGINQQQALDSLRSTDLIGIGMESDAIRRRLHPEQVVTYSLFASIRTAADPAALIQQAAEANARGATGLALSGAVALGLEPLLQLGRSLRTRLPEVALEAPAAEELAALAADSAVSPADLLVRLRDAGFDALSPEAPPVASLAFPTYLEFHRAAHEAGIRTVAALTFGAGEPPEARIAALAQIDAVQQQTGGFLAFTAEPFAVGLEGPTAVDSLRTLAVARLMLDAIDSIRATQAHGLKVLETALRFGADDAGPLPLPPTAQPDLREEDLRRIIRDAGFTPAERHHSQRMLSLA